MAATKVYVPRETAAISVGADDVAIEIARQAKVSGENIELLSLREDTISASDGSGVPPSSSNLIR